MLPKVTEGFPGRLIELQNQSDIYFGQQPKMGFLTFKFNFTSSKGLKKFLRPWPPSTLSTGISNLQTNGFFRTFGLGRGL